MIERLQALGPGQSREAWQLLLHETPREQFAMALDVAVEMELIDGRFAAQLRGENAVAPEGAWINPIDGSEMIPIPAGWFFAGSGRRKLRNQVFFMARHPVTNAQFARFLEATGYSDSGADFLAHWPHRRLPSELAKHPVTFVSYVDAWHYCRWAGLTVPSQWLWERAARGDDGRNVPWGYDAPHLRRGLRRGLESLLHLGEQTCEVTRFPGVRTAYGCEQMLGNVAQWCQPDDWPEDLQVRQRVPSLDDVNALESAVVRGTPYLRTIVQPVWHIRNLSPTRRNRWVGFRPAFYPPGCRE